MSAINGANGDGPNEGEPVIRSAGVAQPSIAERLDLFPVPVMTWHWPEAADRKAEIIGAIRQRRDGDPGMKRTNRDGWHSRTNLPAWSEPGIQELVRWVASCAQAASLEWREGIDASKLGPWRMNGWANVNPAGAHNIAHHHIQRNWHWSACYYVHLGEISSEDLGGALVFHDNDTGLNLKSSESRRSHRVVPREGQLILFPAWLHHSVEPHSSEDDRISIAFNLHNLELERSRFWKYRPPLAWRIRPGLMARYAKWRGRPDRRLNAPPPGWDIILTIAIAILRGSDFAGALAAAPL